MFDIGQVIEVLSGYRPESQEHELSHWVIDSRDASAGAIFTMATPSGEFQAVIHATAPNGSYFVKLRMPGESTGMTEPSSLSARPA